MEAIRELINRAEDMKLYDTANYLELALTAENTLDKRDMFIMGGRRAIEQAREEERADKKFMDFMYDLDKAKNSLGRALI